MRYPSPSCDRNRKLKRDLSSFLGLVAEPADLVAGVRLPANGTLYASCDANMPAPAAVVTINGTPYCIGTGGNLPQPIQYAERNATVTKVPEAIGTITLYVRGNFGQLLPIAHG